MATKENLMGLGMNHILANRMGRTPALVTAQGTTMGDARVIVGTDYDAVIALGTGGVVLRSPGSAGSGVLLGDLFYFTNITAASIALYIRGAVAYVNGVSVSGSLGLSVGVGQSLIARPITASTWTIIGSVLSN